MIFELIMENAGSSVALEWVNGTYLWTYTEWCFPIGSRNLNALWGHKFTSCWFPCFAPWAVPQYLAQDEPEFRNLLPLKLSIAPCFSTESAKMIHIVHKRAELTLYLAFRVYVWFFFVISPGRGWFAASADLLPTERHHQAGSCLPKHQSSTRFRWRNWLLAGLS